MRALSITTACFMTLALSSCSGALSPSSTPSPVTKPAPTVDSRCPGRIPADPAWVCRKGPSPSPTPFEVGDFDPVVSPQNLSRLGVLFEWHPTELLNVAWLPHSTRIVAVVWNDPRGDEGGIQFFDLPPQSNPLFVPIWNAWDVAPSPDASFVAVTREPAGDVALVESAGAFTIRDLDDPEERCGSGSLVAYSPGEDAVFTFLRGETWSQDSYTVIYQWDPRLGKCIGPYAEIDGWVLDASFSPDGDRLAIAYGPNQGTGPIVELWDTSTRQVICSANGSGVEFNPAGDALAVPDIPTRSVSLIDATTCLPKFTIENAGAIGPVTFSPDGSLLAVASNELDSGTYTDLQFWHAATGEPLARIDLSGDSADHLAFDSSGRYLLAARRAYSGAGERAKVSLWGIPH